MMVNPRKKPKFLKQGISYLKRIRIRWRKPRGRDSKLRKKEKSKGRWPRAGYMAPKASRWLHPSGLKEVYVQNLSDLMKVDPKKEAIRLSGTIGEKKRKMIIENAKEKGIRILNE